MAEEDNSIDDNNLFTGVEHASQRKKKGAEVENSTSDSQPTIVDSSRNSQDSDEGLVEDVDEDTIADVVSGVADTFQKNQEDKREHSRVVLRMEMFYNASILGVLSTLILIFTFLADLDPLLGLTFIAGLATGFGTNTALTSLSQ